MDYSQFPRNNILCYDMRSFYASVECVSRGLDPMKAMLAVVGDPNRKGSIVLASSPALKKKYGISNVSRFFELPNDPNIVIAKARMQYYINVSAEITKRMTTLFPPEAIQVYSIDECWLTLGNERSYGSPMDAAKMIQDIIYEEFGLPCVVGVGDNKFLSKVVMDIYSKKSKTGLAECRYEDVERLLWPIELSKVWGIGSRLTHHLNRMGIYNLGGLAKHPLHRLKKRFGVIGEQLYWHAWGVDLSPIYGDFVEKEQKGYGHGITLLRDYNDTEIKTVILELCEEACRRARTDNMYGRTIHLSIGYSRDTGGGFSRSISIDAPSNTTMEMYKVCLHLFHKFYDGDSLIRRASVTLTNLSKDSGMQLSLFDNPKQKDIGPVMDQIRERFGPTAILRASSYTDAGITIDRSKKVGGHYA
ncbi:UV damage repair protein UvrX [Gracilibacillus sp. YIM 98692]|uniref:Y-family DNA polymerase n=1 Tax=Gracilibacillus sp. YIM 98692 TaxID=2663532 RepID=UPI0013CFF87E|nr:UV damage repair protein UvrX [Gracilibacillus sp. YIM 98692]